MARRDLKLNIREGIDTLMDSATNLSNTLVNAKYNSKLAEFINSLTK